MTARGRLHDRVLVEGISECPAHVDIPEQRVLRPVDPLGPVVEADVVVREVGVDVAVDPGRRRDGVNGRAVDLGVPVDVTVDDGLGRRGGVGDDLFDDVRDVRLAAVVVGVLLEVDLLAGDALVEEERTTGNGRVVLLEGAHLGHVDAAVNRGRRDRGGQVDGEERSKGRCQCEDDGVVILRGDPGRRVGQRAPVERGVGVQIGIGLDLNRLDHVGGGDGAAVAPLGVFPDLDGPCLQVGRHGWHPVCQVGNDVQVLIGLVQVREHELDCSRRGHVAHFERVQSLGVRVEGVGHRATLLDVGRWVSAATRGDDEQPHGRERDRS